MLPGIVFQHMDCHHIYALVAGVVVIERNEVGPWTVG